MLVNVESTLERKGIRRTAVRLLVLDSLLQQTVAIRLNDLVTYIHRSDRVTLYRTLKKPLRRKAWSIRLKTEPGR